MQAYRVETVIQKDGALNLSNLPLKAGSSIEVIILVQPAGSADSNLYPLRGKPITFLQPTDPVAQEDWCASQ